MNTDIHTDTIFLVERTIDCDGRGWAFRKLRMPDDMVTDYVTAVANWERECAMEYNALIDLWCIPADHRRLFVEGGAFDRAVAQRRSVKDAVTALYAARDAIEVYVKENEVNTYSTHLSECDMVGEAEFESRYWPLILAADMANENHWHERHFNENGYTSIFNGR